MNRAAAFLLTTAQRAALSSLGLELADDYTATLVICDQCDAPDLRLPTQPQSIAVVWPRSTILLGYTSW